MKKYNQVRQYAFPKNTFWGPGKTMNRKVQMLAYVSAKEEENGMR